MKFVKEHAYETALAVLIVIFGGSILSFYSSVMEAVSAYPSQITTLVILAALVGAFLSSMFDRKEALVERERQKGETERKKMDQKEKEAERLRKEEQEKAAVEAERLRQYESDRRAAMKLDVRKKAMLKAASEHEIYCSDSSFHFQLDESFVNEFFDQESIGDFKNRLYLNEKANRWLADYPATFDVIDDDEVMMHAVFDKTEKTHPGNDQKTAGMGWWWYSHDDEPNPDKLRELRRNTTINGHFDPREWM